MRDAKRLWQREQRARFAREHGYSTAAHYSDGGNRQMVLERDGYKCVGCGMTDAEHREEWGRPITVDHKDRDRSHNEDDNLQTLCLRCHGRKDLLPRLRAQRVPEFKAEIQARRSSGQTYQEIADALGFTIGAIWKWCIAWGEPRTKSRTGVRRGVQTGSQARGEAAPRARGASG